MCGHRFRVVDGADLGEAFAVAFSPLDSRVFSFEVEDSAALAVAGRSASARITMPLPSNEIASTSVLSPGAGPHR